ncbi:MAG: TIM barrel protein [Pirellulales bacterium]|nr:TIM barrel protein [Pirellulales bacterium]
MMSRIDRRGFLRTTGAVAAGLSFAAPWGFSARADETPRGGLPHAEKLGWRLGCQAYTFNRFTFWEAVEKVKTLGLRYIEAYPGQRLDSDRLDVQMGPDLSADARAEVKKRLADAGVTLVNYGVCGLSKDEADARKTFEFAKDMGIETIVSEPPQDAFDVLEKLCDEFEINLALHNHPSPSIYWDYKTVLEACEGRSKRIGACADTGHWMRSGIQPLEAIKALEGRIISFHLKDLNEFNRRDAHDVPWGTGKARMRAILAELHRQKFQGVFSVEYEHNWLDSVPEIAHCAGFLDGVAAQLLMGSRTS